MRIIFIALIILLFGCSDIDYKGEVVDSSDITILEQTLHKFDKTYYKPTPKEADRMVRDWQQVIKRDYSVYYDCDDFSQQMVVYIKRKYNKYYMKAESVAIFNWFYSNHMIVAILTTEGFQFYEPKTGMKLNEDALYYDKFKLGF